MNNKIAVLNISQTVKEKVDAIYAYMIEMLQDDPAEKYCSTKEISDAMGYSTRCVYRYLRELIDLKLIYKGIGSKYYLSGEDKLQDKSQVCDVTNINQTFDAKLDDLKFLVKDLTKRISLIESSMSKVKADIALDNSSQRNTLSFKSNCSRLVDIVDLSHWTRKCGIPDGTMKPDWTEFTIIGKAIYGVEDERLLVNYIKPAQIEYGLMAAYILLWCRYKHYGFPATELHPKTAVLTDYQRELISEAERFVDKFTIQSCIWNEKAYLLTDHWKRVRRAKQDQVKKKYGQIICEKYREKLGNDHSSRPFSIHHLHYDTLWREDPEKDLVNLCRKCHEKEHGITSR